MWRLSGIYRPVQLWVRPLAHISDYHVTAIPNADYSQANVEAKISICNTGKDAVKNLRAVLQFNIASDSFGLSRTVRVSPLSPLQRTLPLLAVGDTTTVELTCTIDKPEMWSAEKPKLYP